MNNPLSEKKMLSAGQILKLRRVELGRSLAQASEETKVQQKYLQQIEEDKYSLFESEVFLSGYIKIYSTYLGLNVDKILAIFRRSQKLSRDKTVVVKASAQSNPISAKAVGLSTLLLSVITIIIYFSFQLYNFQRVPSLIITNPENNSKSSEETIVITGQTDSNAYITINDVRVEKKTESEFSEEISLVDGVNTITIKAIREKNDSKETVTVLTIDYDQIDEESSEDTSDESKEKAEVNNTFTLKIDGSAAWVNLSIDNKQELVQVLNSGFEETYEISESFTIISGKTASTFVTLTGAESPIIWHSSEGVGTISCTLDNNLINCDN